MPTPGPRDQFGPAPGYRNPESRDPDFFNHYLRPGPIWWPGRSPGTMIVTLRGCRLGFGQIRRLWRQSIDYVPAQASYSWTESAPGAGGPVTQPTGGYFITRALRYMTRSVYIGAGVDHSRFDELHTVVGKQNNYKTVTVNAGQKRNAPTVRNRLTSFGSRVPTLNKAVSAAQSQQPGGATQA